MQAMAASVLLRGLLFASMHQAPRRWLPLRKSAWGVAQQGIAANLAQLRRLIWAKTGSSYAPETFPGRKSPTRQLGLLIAATRSCFIPHILLLCHVILHLIIRR